jgi:hypothetical protein
MGISSNQARFLALTARSVDLEFRTQQICQRRLRLSSELENVATEYNNQISNRQLYAYNTTNSGISSLTLANVAKLTDTNGSNYSVIGKDGAGLYQNVTYSAGTLSVGTKTYDATALGLDSSASEEDYVEAALRAGVISVATKSDEYTQDPTYLNGATSGQSYEIKDWRTLPNIADELYSGDDTAAENKYDRTVEQINAQDKKLQLEQASIDVEYKAVTSEKEAVKKILDTNAQSSFKYFS